MLFFPLKYCFVTYLAKSKVDTDIKKIKKESTLQKSNE